jgi:hypothetical protein
MEWKHDFLSKTYSSGIEIRTYYLPYRERKYIFKKISKSQHRSNLSICISKSDHTKKQYFTVPKLYISTKSPIPVCNQCSLRHFSSLVPYFPGFYILSTSQIEDEEKGTKI